MRSVRQQKSHQRFQHVPASKPVRRQPMATPVKKDRKLTVSFSGGFATLKNIVSFFRRRWGVAIGVISLFAVLVLFFTTRLFEIQVITYKFLGDSEDCVSEQIIQETYFKKSPYVLSHFFLDGESLRKKYPCLDTLTFDWNPFAFNTLTVTVLAEHPIAQFTFVRVEDTTQEVRYVTRVGNFISLVSTPSLPQFRYLIPKDQKIDSLHLLEKELETLLQLQKYIKSEYDTDAIPDMTADGTVKFAAPFAEEIYVTLHDDLSVQLGSLQAILRMSTIDKKKIRVIDLRFGNPVITFKQ